MSVLGLGQWDGLVRFIAGADYDRARVIARWPVVEVLHAYMHALRAEAARSYRHSVMVWAMLGARAKAKRPPDPPSILTE